MPSPVGHLLGGVIVGLACLPAASPGIPAGSASRFRVSRALALCAAVAVVPDLDFLWGRHNMETHSLGVALVAGLAVWLLSRRRALRLALAVVLAWGSHVLFDWLGSDDTPPLGVMALWPLTDTFYFADAFVFDAISRRYSLPNFWPHNLGAVVKEAAMLTPVAALLWWLRRR